MCDAINRLSTQNYEGKGEGDGTDPGMFAAHLAPNEKQKIAKIIGRKCTIKGKLSGKE